MLSSRENRKENFQHHFWTMRLVMMSWFLFLKIFFALIILFYVMVFFKFDVVYMCGISLFKLVGLRLINDIVGILHNGIKYIKKNPVIATKDFMQLLKKIT